jgi:hypothetical protein
MLYFPVLASVSRFRMYPRGPIPYSLSPSLLVVHLDKALSLRIGGFLCQRLHIIVFVYYTYIVQHSVHMQ